MRFFKSTLVAVAALASVVAAQVQGTATAPPATAPATATPPATTGGPRLGDNPLITPTSETSVAGGRSVSITWQPTTGGTITLILRKGVSTNLDVVETIASGIPNSGTYTWTPSSNLVTGADYAIEIRGSTGSPNYSQQFGISGSSSSSSSSSSSASTTATRNTTSTSTTISTSTTRTSSSSTSQPTNGSVPNNNSSGAGSLSSPLALILCVAAGIIYLN